MVLEPDTELFATKEAVPQRRHGVPVTTLGPTEGGFGKDPTSMGERKEFWRGCWAPKGGGL